MKITRRTILQGAGAGSVLAALGCGGSKSARPVSAKADDHVAGAPHPAIQGGPKPKPGEPPHYLVLVTLNGGYDNVMSVAPKEQDKIGDKIFCGYRTDERIRGSKRMFGPLIGGLERHDDDLCLIHGVRSDTVAHPDGLGMLARGSRSARPGPIAMTFGKTLSGNAPLPNLDLGSLDGKVVLHDRERPKWADVRAQAQRAQVAALGGTPAQTEMLGGITGTTANLERFLTESQVDAAELDKKLTGFLGHHFRVAFQAIRGNWAKCTNISSSLLYFDSHSDNTRFQRERQPSTFADLATFVDLLKSTRNDFGPLFDQTTIAVFSEFGRFPRLNGQGGKDHFPENSWILLGRGVKKGATIGGVDDIGKGLAIDFRSGQASADHGQPIYLDNAFATLLAIAGGDPVKAGYGKDAVLGCVKA